MKKIIGLLALILLVTACDDGEMTVKSFNFTAEPDECAAVENYYVKTNGTEALMLDLTDNPLLNVEGTREIPLANGKVIYRNYSGTTSREIICGGGVSNPDVYVLEEWTGSGTIEVVTTKLPVGDDGFIRYSHTITFLDVSLTKGNETIRIQNTDYGEVTTNLGIKFRFASTTETPIQLLDCNGTPYTYSTGADFVGDRDALRLNFAPGTFENIVDETTINLGNTNSLYLTHFDGSIGPSVICPTGPVITPNVIEAWLATTGRVKIVKSTDSSNVVHYDIYLYDDIKFFNITSSAVATESFIPEPNGSDADGSYYYLGQYTP